MSTNRSAASSTATPPPTISTTTQDAHNSNARFSSAVVVSPATTAHQSSPPAPDDFSIRYSSHFLGTQIPLQQCAKSCYICGVHLPYFALRRTDVDHIEEDMRLVERGRMVSPPPSEEEGGGGMGAQQSSSSGQHHEAPFMLEAGSPPSVMMASHCFNCSRLLCARCCLIRAVPEAPMLMATNPHTSICNILSDGDVSAPVSQVHGIVLFEDEQRNPLTEPRPGFIPPTAVVEPPSLSSFLGRLLHRGGTTVSRVANTVSSKVSQARAGTLFGQGGYCRGVTVCTSCFLFDLGYIVAYSGITQATHLFTSQTSANEFLESLPAYCSKAMSHIGTGRIVTITAKKSQERDALTLMLADERRRLLALGYDNSLKVSGERGRALREFMEKKMGVVFRRLHHNHLGQASSASSSSTSPQRKYLPSSSSSPNTKRKDGSSGGWDFVGEGGDNDTSDPIDRSLGGVVSGVSEEVLRIVHLNSAGYSKSRSMSVSATTTNAYNNNNNMASSSSSSPGNYNSSNYNSASPLDAIVTEEAALLQEELDSLHTANSEMIQRVQTCLRGAVRDRLRDEDSDLARSYDLLPESASSPKSTTTTNNNNTNIRRASTSDFESLGSPSQPPSHPASSRFTSTFASATLRDDNGNVVPFERGDTDIQLASSSITPARHDQLLADRVHKSDVSVPPDAWVEEITKKSYRSPSDYLEEHSLTALTSMLSTSHGALTLLPHYLTIAVVWYSSDGCFEHTWLQCCGLETPSGIDEDVINRGITFIRETASKALFGACVSLTGDLLATVEDPHNQLNPDRAASELASCGVECCRYLSDLPAYIGTLKQQPSPPAASAAAAASSASSSPPPRRTPSMSPTSTAVGASGDASQVDDITSIQWVPSVLQAVKELVCNAPVGTRGAVLDADCRLVAGRGLGVVTEVLMSEITKFMASVSENEDAAGREDCHVHPVRTDVVHNNALQQVISTCSPDCMSSRESLLRRMGTFVLRHRRMRALFVLVPGSMGIESSEVYPIQTFTDAQGLLRDYGAGVLVGLPEGDSQMSILYRHPSTSRTLSLNLLNMSMRTPIVHAYLDAAKIKVPRRGDKAAAVERPPTTGGARGGRGGVGGGDAGRRSHISDETFDCSICFEPYNTKDRRPCICTSCGNTLCSCCVGKISKCSFCRVDMNSSKVVPNVLIMQMLSTAAPSSSSN